MVVFFGQRILETRGKLYDIKGSYESHVMDNYD